MGLVKSRPVAGKSGEGRRNAKRVQQAGSAELPRAPAEAASAQLFASSLTPDGFLALRQAILDGEVDLADAAVADGIIGWFEGCDAAGRTRAVDSLMALSVDLSPVLTRLLQHANPSLRLVGVSLLEFRRNPDVEQHLLALMERDADVRVCGAALDLLCELGTEAALEPLERLKARFASEAYIQFAVALATARIREI